MALRLTRSRTSIEQRNSNLSGIGMHEELAMASAEVAVALPRVLWTLSNISNQYNTTGKKCMHANLFYRENLVKVGIYQSQK